VVRRLVGYGRFDGVETAGVMARLYAVARLHVNFFQPSFKLKEKRREGAKVIKRYHAPATPYERALTHPRLSKAIKPAAAGDVSRSRSRSAARRDARGTGGARRAHRQAWSCRGDRRIGGGPACLCTIARHGGLGRRGARDTSCSQAAVQETDTHALQARSASGGDRKLAGSGAIDGARHRPPAGCDRSSDLQRQAALDRAAPASVIATNGGGDSDRNRDTASVDTTARACGRRYVLWALSSAHRPFDGASLQTSAGSRFQPRYIVSSG
jgi:hypothetical protein